MGRVKSKDDRERDKGWRIPHRAVLDNKRLTVQVSELTRVICKMRSAYPGMVAKGALAKRQDEQRVAAVEAARRLLEGLREKEQPATEKNRGKGAGSMKTRCANVEAKRHFSTDPMIMSELYQSAIRVDSLKLLRYHVAVHQPEREDIMEDKPEIIRELELVATGKHRYVTATYGLRRTQKRVSVSGRDAQRILDVYERLPEETAQKYAGYGYPMMLVALPLLENIGRLR